MICDRYYDSTYAYQGAARELDMDIIDTLTQYATFNTVPELSILLDLPVAQGLARIKKRKLDRLERENVAFHEKVRQQFLFIAKKQASRYLVIDGSKPAEEIHQEILRALKFC